MVRGAWPTFRQIFSKPIAKRKPNFGRVHVHKRPGRSGDVSVQCRQAYLELLHNSTPGSLLFEVRRCTEVRY